MVNSYMILVWVHIVSMLGVLGGLLLLQWGVPWDIRSGSGFLKGYFRPINVLLAIGFIAGVILYVQRLSGATGRVHGVVGLKILILLAVGALVPMSRNAARGDALRWTAILLLLIASFSGLTI